MFASPDKAGEEAFEKEIQNYFPSIYTRINIDIILYTISSFLSFIECNSLNKKCSNEHV